MRRPVHPHLVYARLLVFDKTLAQHHFSVVNCSDEFDECVLLPCFNAPPDIFCSYELLYRSAGCTYFPPIA